MALPICVILQPSSRWLQEIQHRWHVKINMFVFLDMKLCAIHNSVCIPLLNFGYSSGYTMDGRGSIPLQNGCVKTRPSIARDSGTLSSAWRHIMRTIFRNNIFKTIASTVPPLLPSEESRLPLSALFCHLCYSLVMVIYNGPIHSKDIWRSAGFSCTSSESFFSSTNPSYFSSPTAYCFGTIHVTFLLRLTHEMVKLISFFEAYIYSPFNKCATSRWTTSFPMLTWLTLCVCHCLYIVAAVHLSERIV